MRYEYKEFEVKENQMVTICSLLSAHPGVKRIPSENPRVSFFVQEGVASKKSYWDEYDLTGILTTYEFSEMFILGDDRRVRVIYQQSDSIPGGIQSEFEKRRIVGDLEKLASKK